MQTVLDESNPAACMKWQLEARAVHVVADWLAVAAAATTYILHGKLALLYTLGLQY